MQINYYQKHRYGYPDNIIADDRVRECWYRLMGLKTIDGKKIEDLENFIEAIGGNVKFKRVLEPEEK